MMGIRAISLLPFGLIWGLVAMIKRKVFTVFNIRKTPPIRTWVVGNIQAGGQGKTPTIIALYEWLQSTKGTSTQIAILSRGYGRKTKGYRRVTSLESAKTVGDEPFEIYHSIKENQEIHRTKKGTLEIIDKTKYISNHDLSSVFVCEDRLIGISKIQRENPNTSLVLLDDGFQHLKLRATGNIILTKFGEPFCDDLPLPAGNLREFPSAAKAANIILVTHSPHNLSLLESEKWRIEFFKKMRFWGVKQDSVPWMDKIFFVSNSTSIPVQQSDLTKYSSNGASLVKGQKIILITGVANAKGIVNALNSFPILHHFEYADHHSFSVHDIMNWKKKHSEITLKTPVNPGSATNHQNECVFVCTRKDYMRIMLLFQENKVTEDFPHAPQDKNTPKSKTQLNASLCTEGENIDLPFYVCHSEVEMLFNKKSDFLNTIINSIDHD